MGRTAIKKTAEQSDAVGRYNIPILSKAMDLLELIALHPLGLTIQEMVNATRHSKTSVYRIVCSLEEMGYLRKEEVSGKCFLTRKLFGLGLSTLGTTTIIEHAYEPMRRLRDSIKETVVLGTLMNDRVVILEQVLGSHHFSFMLKPGMGVGLYASAPGKAILAYMDGPECEAAMSTIDFVRHNERTITSVEGLREELARVSAAGYAMDWGEELHGVHCIGAPVFNQAGKVVAAVWITGPSERLPEAICGAYSLEVMACADEISAKLGYAGCKSSGR